MEPKISVIVAVYNSEKFLARCIQSILAQTFTNFELLLVDDGSKDGSGQICEEYAQADERVRAFHKPNGGVASARQMGIDNAKGLYPIHVDSDDWVEKDMLECLYYQAITDNADMVICDFYVNDSSRQRYISQKPNSLDNDSVLRQLLLQQLHGSSCNKLIRVAAYSGKVAYDERISLWEDLLFNTELLTKGCKVSYLERAFYHYDMFSAKGSLVRKPTLKGLNSQILCIHRWTGILDPKKYHNELYKVKAETKEMAFVSKLLSDQDVENLFDEINVEYIANSSKSFITKSFALAQLLKGHPFQARIIYWLSGFPRLIYYWIKMR